MNNQGAFYCGHSLSYVGKIGGAYTVYEVKGLKNNDKVGKQFEDIKGSLILSKNKIESPAQWVLGLFGKDKNAGAIMYNFESKSEMDNFFKKGGETKDFDKVIEFKVTEQEAQKFNENALADAQAFNNYTLLGNNCGTFATQVITKSVEDIKLEIPNGMFYTIRSNIPKNMFNHLYTDTHPTDIYMIENEED